MTAGAADLVVDYSKQRATDETLRLLFDLARAAKVEEHRDAMFAGKHINTTEDRAVLHVALRMPPGSKLHVDGQDVVGDVQAVLGQMGDLSDRIRNGCVDRGDGQADRRCRQHRDRRLGPRPPHGHPGPRRLRAAGPDEPLRVQRRPGRSVLGHARPGPRDDPLRRQLQDVHDARDADQCRSGPGLAARRAGQRRRRRRGGEALRGGVDQRQRRGGVRYRHRQHAPVLGLGRRPILLRLRHRLLPHGGDRPRGLRRDAGRLPRHRRALPDHALGARTFLSFRGC